MNEIQKAPEHFELREVAIYYTKLAMQVKYPERSTSPPARRDYSSNEAHGKALDEYEAGNDKQRDDLKAYRQQVVEIENAFKAELIERLGLTEHPKANKLYEIAWDSGHSEGFYEVASIAEDLAELLRD